MVRRVRSVSALTQPGTITRTADGRYEVHSLTSSTTVDTLQLAELVAARVRKAYGVAASNTRTPRKGTPAGVRRKKTQDGP
jgi:hypothetical protein